MSRSVLTFPDSFQFGVATAPHQIEGGNIHSDWWAFEQQVPSPVKKGEKSGVACDHWNRVDTDTELLKALRVQVYRLGVEWARLEPKEGVWDREAALHYRREIELLHEAGIDPWLTLQHFTLPAWLETKGGWTFEGVSALFARFTRFVFETIAFDVKTFVTINEPMVHLGGGYVLGVTPPALRSSREAARQKHPTSDHAFVNAPPPLEDLSRLIPPMRGCLESHALAYAILHALARARGQTVRVGFAHHLRVFDPMHAWSPLDWIAARTIEKLWNWSVPDALETGRFRLHIPGQIDVGFELPELKGTQDFFGLNYYSRDRVGLSLSLNLKLGTTPGAPENDMGWEIYPEGLTRVLRAADRRYARKKYVFLITENGIADSTDTKRTDFICDHLSAIHTAMEAGVRVEGYCHWSFLDNFEWIEGYDPRFGLYAVDYPTQTRRLRESGKRFAEIARTKSLRASSRGRG